MIFCAFLASERTSLQVVFARSLQSASVAPFFFMVGSVQWPRKDLPRVLK